MANSSNKLEIFQQLIQESDLFVNLRDALVSLKAELTDSDEENIIIIEKWLQDKPEILKKYRTKLMKSGDKLPNQGRSTTTPEQRSQILKDIIENLTVAAEKPPEPKQTPPSSL